MLLKQTRSLFANPDEDSQLIREARDLWHKLKELISKPHDYNDVMWTYECLMATYEQVKRERARAVGHQLLVEQVMASDEMEELVFKLDGLKERLPQSQLDQIFQECLDAVLKD